MDINEKILIPIIVGVISAVVGGLILKILPHFRKKIGQFCTRIYKYLFLSLKRYIKKKFYQDLTKPQYSDFYGVCWEWKKKSDGTPVNIKCKCPECKSKITPITKGYGSVTNFKCQHCHFTPKPIPYPSEIMIDKIKEKILCIDSSF